MAVSTFPTLRSPSAIEAADLRQQMLAPAAVLLTATGFYGCLAYLLGEPFHWREFTCFAATLLLGLLVRRLHQSSTAPTVFILGAYALVALAAGLLVTPVAPLALAIPIAAATLYGVPWATAAAAALSAVCLVAVHALVHPQPQLGLALLTYALQGSLLALSTRSTYTLLGWSWRRHEEALRLTDALRDRQGVLNRTVKALDLAYRLLQSTNHQLAVAQQEADEARRFKEQFAANISHELRTPLNLIMGFSEMMYESPQVYGEVNWTVALRRDIGRIYDASRHLSRLVEDVLDLSRLNAGQMPIRRQECDLRDIIQEAIGTTTQLRQQHHVAIRSELDDSVPRLLLDATRMKQVMFNLLTNALRFTPEGEVVVSTRCRDEDVLVTVRDTGVGIPESELESIFGEFYQVNTRDDVPGGGMGLGLAISRRFVQMHGGRMWAESQVGVGSSFHISLPLAAAAVPTSRLTTWRPLPVPARPDAEAVVFLGHEPDLASLLDRHLDGYRVLTTNDGESLRALVEAQRPRALIHNLSLSALRALAPRLPGRDLVPMPPLVLCSIPSVSWRQEMLGVFASLQKPVRRQELLGVLARLEGATDVLVVDDDRGFSQMVARMLENAGKGYSVRRAHSGADGLAAMRKTPPDVLILDLLMPGLGGAALLAAARQDERLASVPVIVVTAADVEADLGTPHMNVVALVQSEGWGIGDALRAVNQLLAHARPIYPTRPAKSQEPATGPAD